VAASKQPLPAAPVADSVADSTDDVYSSLGSLGDSLFLCVAARGEPEGRPTPTDA
jgi:hypothetical protein